MTVSLALDGSSPSDGYAYLLLEQAFRLRGGTKDQKLPKAERRKDACIKAALDRISVPRDSEGPAPAPGEPDGRPRQLCEGPQALVLEIPEFERLVSFFDSEEMVWSTHVVDVAEQTSQRLAAALHAAS